MFIIITCLIEEEISTIMWSKDIVIVVKKMDDVKIIIFSGNMLYIISKILEVRFLSFLTT